MRASNEHPHCCYFAAFVLTFFRSETLVAIFLILMVLISKALIKRYLSYSLVSKDAHFDLTFQYSVTSSAMAQIMTRNLFKNYVQRRKISHRKFYLFLRLLWNTYRFSLAAIFEKGADSTTSEEKKGVYFPPWFSDVALKYCIYHICCC